jgi:hypothetical protein
MHIPVRFILVLPYVDRSLATGKEFCKIQNFRPLFKIATGRKAYYVKDSRRRGNITSESQAPHHGGVWGCGRMASRHS